MDIYTQTSLKIDFVRGEEITPTIVLDGVGMVGEDYNKTFSNKTHQIEELLDYITHNENGGFDVFI